MKYLLILFAAIGLLMAEITVPPGMEASFIQKVTNPNKKVIRYSGSVIMDNGKRFKWSYRSPTRKEVCSDGKRVIVVDHDLEQVSFYRMDKGFDLGAVLKRARHYKDNLYTARYQGRTYTLAVDGKGRIEQVAYRDDMDNVVNIRLQKLKILSRPPSAAKMRCPYPKSYDRIEG
ncbi:LolA-like outer membrane lipoprotein chaperone [Nitratifractor sp.]